MPATMQKNAQKIRVRAMIPACARTRYICGEQSVGKSEKAAGVCLLVYDQAVGTFCVLVAANAECLFPRLEWQSSGRPVVRLPSFLQAVRGYQSRKEACRTLLTLLLA